ncbi:MAG TPA: hypothetical protein VJ246_02040 [Patescibacteria group bacterium]|nr:hypothetical protein [Patescibacteria group bacterium]
MSKELRKYPLDYLFLTLLLGTFIGAYFFIWPDVTSRRVLASCLGMAYFLWGVRHHAMQHTLNTRIVLEYFFVGLLAAALLTIINMT